MHFYHEVDEGLERQGAVGLHQLVVYHVHVVVRVHDAEACEGGTHLRHAKRVGLVLVKVSERALELLQLRGRQVGHVTRHNLIVFFFFKKKKDTHVSERTQSEVTVFAGTLADLIVDELELLRHRSRDEGVLELEVLTREDGIVVLLDVRQPALVLRDRDAAQDGSERL